VVVTDTGAANTTAVVEYAFGRCWRRWSKRQSSLPALLLSVPLFLPLAQAFKIDLVHLGVVMCANLAIALYTPPVGGTLFSRAAAMSGHHQHLREAS